MRAAACPRRPYRPHRLLLLALVGLWLACLPLQGWAQLRMALPGPAEPPPCHAMAEPSQAATPEAASHSPCSHCALCHATALPWPASLPAAGAPGPQPLPAAPLSALHAPPPELPFKPPRA